MVAVELAGGFEQAARVASQVGLFTHAVSLGGVDSLVQHPAALTHRPVSSEAKPSDALLRFSIGVEDVEDLRRDLEQALDRLDPHPGRTTSVAVDQMRVDDADRLHQREHRRGPDEGEPLGTQGLRQGHRLG